MRPVVLLLLLILGACTSQSNVRLVCPTLIEYSQIEQNKLAEEIKEAKNKEYIVIFLRGYSSLREQVKSCQN